MSDGSPSRQKIKTVSWAAAQTPLPRESPAVADPGHLGMFNAEAPTFPVLLPVKVPQRTLRELGLPLKFAVNPILWPQLERGTMAMDISVDSYPWSESFAGTAYTPRELYDRTPAFRYSYANPDEMLKALKGE